MSYTITHKADLDLDALTLTTVTSDNNLWDISHSGRMTLSRFTHTRNFDGMEREAAILAIIGFLAGSHIKRTVSTRITNALTIAIRTTLDPDFTQGDSGTVEFYYFHTDNLSPEQVTTLTQEFETAWTNKQRPAKAAVEAIDHPVIIVPESTKTGYTIQLTGSGWAGWGQSFLKSTLRDNSRTLRHNSNALAARTFVSEETARTQQRIADRLAKNIWGDHSSAEIVRLSH